MFEYKHIVPEKYSLSVLGYKARRHLLELRIAPCDGWAG